MAKLVCKLCNSSYSTNEKIWKCRCGGLIDIDFNAKFPIEKFKSRKPNLWRYREAIPIEHDKNIVSFDEGFTPLLNIDIGGKNVLVKQDHLFLTGSYKDRGASILMSKVKELGIKHVVEDSSGNAGCAIAAYSAKAGIKSDIFVPSDNSPAKLIQIKSYGALLKKIKGSREDTARAVLKAAEKHYYASHSYNPFFFQGTKTFAFEVCEQLDWKSPDSIVVPVGNGTLLLGAYLGFNELLTAGVINSMPKIIGVQTENCNPIYRAFNEKLDYVPKINKKATLAEGIAIAEPVRGKEIIEAVRNSKGRIIQVSDKEIKESLIDICSKGYYIEPTSTSTIAGVKKYSKDEVIVSVFTGHGLKTTEKMLKIFH